MYGKWKYGYPFINEIFRICYFYSFSYFLFVEIEPHCIGKLVGSATFDNCELIFLKVFHALRKTCCVNVRDPISTLLFSQ